MKTQFDIDRIIKNSVIESELDYERALIADRKLRVLAKDNPELKTKRNRIRDLIASYEAIHWPKSTITDAKMNESDRAISLAEKERIFIQSRKELIKIQLKQLEINQQEFGILLGHDSKSYISELMNGIKPFSLKDIVVINRLLKIDFDKLIPTILTEQDRQSINTAFERIGKSKSTACRLMNC